MSREIRACPRDAVLRLKRAVLTVRPEPWAFAHEHADEIDAHWVARRAENPSFFNGVIHLLRGAKVSEGVLGGELVRTDFMSFLYWREHGHRDDSVRDAFGSALLRSAEGHVVLGRQRPGNVNSGLTYLPGGFIDAADVDASGAIDIEASILRELGEETGIGEGEVQRMPGLIATCDGPLISIAAEYRSPLPSAELRDKIRAFIAAEDDPELEDVVVVRSRADLVVLELAPYARRLLESPLIFP